MHGHELWELQRDFYKSRPLMDARQTPLSLAKHLRDERDEVIHEFNHFQEVVEHNGDLHKLMFELADMAILSIHLAQVLGRDDLRDLMVAQLTEGDTVLHKHTNPHNSSFPLSMKFHHLDIYTDNLVNHLEQTEEVNPTHDTLTHGLVGIMALVGSIARDVSPEPSLSLETYVIAKQDYNSYRYRVKLLNTVPDGTMSDINSAFNAVRQQIKAGERNLLLQQEDFLPRPSRRFSKAS